MIEIVCDREKGEKGNNNGQAEEFKLPKNLRQVGTPPANKKIYIEDYVVTYLNYIARPGSTEVRGAILVGEKRSTSQGDVIFISGAVDAQNIEFDMNECVFTEEIWTEIYEDIKENFPELSVVGWFLSRMGFSTAINEQIEKLHMDNFPGADKVLYVTDSLESEDAFYMYEKGQLVKQKGYYIYYAKNELMQNYIISKRGEENTEEKNDIRRKDSELLKSYREKNRQLQEDRENNLGIGYVAGGFLALAVLAMGVTIAGNYKKMQNMEVSINRLELTSDATEENTAAAATIITPDELETNEEAAISIKGENTPDDNTSLENGQEVVAESGGNQISSISGENGALTAERDDNSSTVEASSNIQEGLNQTEGAAENDDLNDFDSQAESIDVTSVGDKVVYKVKKGDTLTSIAFLYYGSIEYVDAIVSANSIGEDCIIYEGEELVLPDVD
jgi:LysM repeat protein